MKISKKSILGGPVTMAISAAKNKAADRDNNKPEVVDDQPEVAAEVEPVNAPVRRKGTSDKKIRELLQDLVPILREGEEVLDCTHGTAVVERLGKKTLRRGTIFVSNQRVGVFTKKLGGHDLTDFAFGLITAVQHKEGMMNGEIDLLAADTRLEVHQIPKGEATKPSNLVRNQMAQHHAPGATVVMTAPLDDPAEQLKKLAGLHQTGLLTDEEFAAKREVLVAKL